MHLKYPSFIPGEWGWFENCGLYLNAMFLQLGEHFLSVPPGNVSFVGGYVMVVISKLCKDRANNK